jgi:serine/threonine-protein kinase
VEFLILGPVEVRREGTPLPLRSPKERALLALLVVHSRRVLSTERILDELWPQGPPPSGVKTVRYHVSKLREVLHGDGDDTVLVTVPGGYVLDVDAEQIDAARFELRVEEARTYLPTNPERASRLLRDALASSRGEPLADVVDYPFAGLESARLEGVLLHALEDRLEADLVCGRHAEIVGELEKLTIAHPLRERFFGQLMLAQYRLGRQADALRTCQRLRRTLAEELGVHVGRDIDLLEERILVHDPGLVVGPLPAQAVQVAGRAAVLTSVVVLPFENLSSNEEDRFFADGLTEDIIHALAQVEGLRVISRTSAFALRERGDIREVGRELRAQAVVRGTVRRAGERTRITAELVDLEGFHLWSGRYDRERGDIFAVQEEVAQAVASALKRKLDLRPVIAVPRHTTSVDAYDAFLEGRYQWHRQTREGFDESIRLFERAVSLDADFGKAYAWLAVVRMYSTIFGYHAPSEVIPAAKDEANRAVALEPSLDEAHLTLGLVAQYADWDWPTTERHYRRAIELSPGSATARAWFGLFLARMGREDEAVAQSAAALDLDPLSHESSWLYLIMLTHLGRHAEAVALGQRAAKVHPRSPHIHWPTGMAELGLGESERAVEWIERALACERANPYARAFYVRALVQAGKVDEAREELADLQAERRAGYFSPFILAIAQLAFSHEHAIALLQEAMTVGDAMVPYINHWGMSPLADDPRYREMLDRVGLPNLFPSGRAATPLPAR